MQVSKAPHPLKVVLVLSQVTYLPDSYSAMLEDVCAANHRSIAGVVLIRNSSVSLYLQVVWLFCIGCRGISIALLRNLLSSHDPVAAKISRSYSIPILKVDAINSPAVINWLRANKIDCIINVRTRSIYKKTLLAAPTIGCFNIHHGLLPEYRGMFCDLYALAENRPAGITLHEMTPQIDNGGIVDSVVISKGNEKNYQNYLQRTGVAEAAAINRLLDYLISHGNKPICRANIAKKTHYTRTPTYKQIKAMQRDGMQL